jgi:hypothetical protein
VSKIEGGTPTSRPACTVNSLLSGKCGEWGCPDYMSRPLTEPNFHVPFHSFSVLNVSIFGFSVKTRFWFSHCMGVLDDTVDWWVNDFGLYCNMITNSTSRYCNYASPGLKMAHSWGRMTGSAANGG